MERDRGGDAYERRRHVRRLERAMAAGRAWAPERFEAEVIAHPVLSVIAERVLFVGAAPFRLVEGAPRGLDSEAVELGDAVRVAHPAELPEAELRRWGDHFSERHLRSPFDQLARPTRLSDEGDAIDVGGLGALDGVAITTVLEPRGWARGERDERLRVGHLVRRFGDDDPVAVLGIEPGLGASDAGLQRVVVVCFAAEVPGGVSFADDRVPLVDVPRRLRSEVRYDLSLLPC